MLKTASRPARSKESGDLCVVGIGASAGGLETCRRLIAELPPKAGMAFILIQHLDPTHASMMVDLLASHTPMAVRQAVDGMMIERDHLYVIPPGTYLSVAAGLLKISEPLAHHGARLPFDFLLQSLAEQYGARAVGVVLSGTGSDGSLGLQVVKSKSGLVIAQDPDEAAFDGMPRSAIRSGAVTLVLPVARIADALVKFNRRIPLTEGLGPPDDLQRIIELLRIQTAHNFALYKPGTLRRRIERRMAIKAIGAKDMGEYLALLRKDAIELELLAKDLLIHVTRFFRDPKVFEQLADKIIPDLVARAGPDSPLRVWAPGCSSGEEAYSLAMLFREAIAAAQVNIKLQLFASDVDPVAVASAREGLYPHAIEEDVSRERLDRFFARDDHGYRVSPELRACVVFTVQDVLSDPPFARLDMISCRNLMIYLGAEAQAKVISLFHFALTEGGVLLLGSAETIGGVGGRFEAISKPARLYRRIGGRRAGELGFSRRAGDGLLSPARTGHAQAPTGGAALAELCRYLVMKTHAPAALLINRERECLYSMGPIDRYLRMASGHTTLDILSMARPGVRAKLKSAIDQASVEPNPVVVGGVATHRDGLPLAFSISAQQVPDRRDGMQLICFIDDPPAILAPDLNVSAGELPRIAQLMRELEAAKAEASGAIRDLEVSDEEQKAVNEETLSLNEEFQSTNEELLTSKEELQSLNEELTALNGQLQETLDRQRSTSNDLQNVLYSTDIALLFLDGDLNIRFFTPAMRSMFNIIVGDIGRPLTDLRSLSADDALSADAFAVLKTLEPVDREIEAEGVWFIRRILPYFAHNKQVEGVVITFTDVTRLRTLDKAREDARGQANAANEDKSRFLAAASHDLRQPLQTMSLLQGLLAKVVVGERPKLLVTRLEEALGAMSGMLNAMLDINQIEAGVLHADPIDFPVNDVLDLLRDEYAYHAQAQKLAFHVVSCGAYIRSDPRQLEQMLRNLLSNALKFTKRGKILLGCRRQGDTLRIEVWDTGAGIPEADLATIFDEYRQLDNDARQRSRGLGLGLSIVKRLGLLLDHSIDVRSTPGEGSVFSITAKSPQGRSRPKTQGDVRRTVGAGASPSPHTGAILVIEDDPDVRGPLEWALQESGHHPITVANGPAALAMAADGMARPDLILADFNLPGGMNGLQAAVRLRENFHHPIPVVILTGDVSTATARDIAGQDCVQLNKPVKSETLIKTINGFLPDLPRPRVQAEAKGVVIYVVDDDTLIRAAIRAVLEDEGRVVEDFETAEAFLNAYRPGREACLLIDAYLPGMSGLELLQRLQDTGRTLPAIMITGASDVPMAVRAMKAGAVDFIEKPIGAPDLIAGIARALSLAADGGKQTAWRETASAHLAGLTPRQHEIMDMVLAGQPSKNIAADLGISQRTVENHRAAIMKKTGAKSLPALARLALTAAATT